MHQPFSFCPWKRKHMPQLKNCSYKLCNITPHSYMVLTSITLNLQWWLAFCHNSSYEEHFSTHRHVGWNNIQQTEAAIMSNYVSQIHLQNTPLLRRKKNLSLSKPFYISTAINTAGLHQNYAMMKLPLQGSLVILKMSLVCSPIPVLKLSIWCSWNSAHRGANDCSGDYTTT
jgi:hypothetical protein